MARWRLLEPHYLYLDPPVKWVYNEVDRVTGRPVRKEFEVPQYFHHESEIDWTEFDLIGRGERVNGYVVVTDGKGNFTPKDIKFKGEPTPGMYPLDEEAKAISAQYSAKWSTPDKIWDMNADGSYSSRLTDHLVENQNKVNMHIAELAERRDAGFDKFMQAMTTMMQQNQMILETLALKAAGEPKAPEMAPLEAADPPSAAELAVKPKPSAPPPPVSTKAADMARRA